eukprot:8237366-Pyramimonas_sp.AAC.1
MVPMPVGAAAAAGAPLPAPAVDAAEAPQAAEAPEAPVDAAAAAGAPLPAAVDAAVAPQAPEAAEAPVHAAEAPQAAAAFPLALHKKLAQDMHISQRLARDIVAWWASEIESSLQQTGKFIWPNVCSIQYRIVSPPLAWDPTAQNKKETRMKKEWARKQPCHSDNVSIEIPIVHLKKKFEEKNIRFKDQTPTVLQLGLQLPGELSGLPGGGDGGSSSASSS